MVFVGVTSILEGGWIWDVGRPTEMQFRALVCIANFGHEIATITISWGLKWETAYGIIFVL
jgi:hypothetical protein